MNTPLIIEATLVIIGLIVIIGGIMLYIMKRPDKTPAQFKTIRDVYTESGTDPITGNKYTFTRTESGHVKA